MTLAEHQTSRGTETAEQLRLRIIEQCISIAERFGTGCTDGGCQMRKPTGGMHTNGGCRCWDQAHKSLHWMAEDTKIMRYGRGKCWE